MGKFKSRNDRSRAWSLLRLALLWARRGGVLRRRFMMELREVLKLIKSIGHHNHNARGQIYYAERELSFDRTPIVHVKMHRPASMRYLIPCIGPHVDFDYDFDGGDDDDDGYGCGPRKSFLKNGEEEEEEEEEDGQNGYYGYNNDDDGEGSSEEIASSEEEGIDSRAEKFIAKFYRQMKMQRQSSHLEYNEMLTRSSG